jgi:hypothetical protein
MIWLLLGLGILLECTNALIYARSRASGLPLLAPVCIVVASAEAPGWSAWARVLAVSLAWIAHFLLPLIVPRPPRLRQDGSSS